MGKSNDKFTLSEYYGDVMGWQCIKESKRMSAFRAYLIKKFGPYGRFNETIFNNKVNEVLEEKGASYEFAVKGIYYSIMHY